MAICSSILDWIIPWIEEPGCSPWGHKEPDTTERLCSHTLMGLAIIILSEVSQTEEDNYHLISFICRNQEIIQMSLCIKQKQTRRLRSEAYGYKSRKVEGGSNLEFGFNI